jgi:DegV family protein with EDD domain
LSGTVNAARIAAEQVKAEGVNVHIIDTMTLSAPEGWQLEAAARAIQAGWELDQIKDLLEKVRKASDTVFTLPTLKYLIHGGRISHLTGLVASTLGIRPIIGVDKSNGKYDTRARIRTFKKAVRSIADVVEETHPAGSKVRIQPVHALSPENVESMKKQLESKFDVEWMTSVPIATVLGAHTGAGLVGCAFGDPTKLPELP